MQLTRLGTYSLEDATFSWKCLALPTGRQPPCWGKRLISTYFLTMNTKSVHTEGALKARVSPVRTALWELPSLPPRSSGPRLLFPFTRPESSPFTLGESATQGSPWEGSPLWLLRALCQALPHSWGLTRRVRRWLEVKAGPELGDGVPFGSIQTSEHHFRASRSFLDFAPVFSNWQKVKGLCSQGEEKEIRNLGSSPAPGQNQPQ